MYMDSLARLANRWRLPPNRSQFKGELKTCH